MIKEMLIYTGLKAGVSGSQKDSARFSEGKGVRSDVVSEEVSSVSKCGEMRAEKKRARAKGLR